MENLFVRILEKTLLILGLIFLVCTIGAAIYAGAGLYPSLIPTPDTSQRVEVQYQPLATRGASHDKAASQAVAAPTSNAPLQGASAVCAAEDRFIGALTNGGMRIDNFEQCGQQKVENANDAAPDREVDYLTAERSWFDSLTADPALKKTIPHKNADEVQKAIESEESRFAKAFSDRVSSDNQRSEDLAMRQEFGKLAAVAAGITAASCFALFLVIAFLIVAVRVERHLRAMAAISGRFGTRTDALDSVK